jgi:uncharacterized membrane protein
MQTLSDMMASLADPATRHAVIVHFPVAVAFLAPVPLVASMVLGRKNLAPRYAAIAAYAFLAAVAFAASWSGGAAADGVGDAPAEAGAVLLRHEQMGERLWIFAAATSALAAGGLIRKRPIALTASSLALAGAACTAGWVAVTAHHGGTLVYRFGLGTPHPVSAAGDSPGEAPVPADPRVSHFLARVKPVLTDRCMRCHRAGREEGGLVLTSMEGILRGAEHGPVLTPGNPLTSTIYTTISGLHPRLRMPKSGKELTPDQIEAIRVWIEQGAVWAE